jgi:hypothetical protein
MTQEALKLALEWIEDSVVLLSHTSSAIQGGIGVEAECVGGCSVKAITAIKEALAQPEQEPVAWMDEFGNVFPLGAQRGPKYLNEPMKPLYTTPPQRTEQEPVAKKLTERYRLAMKSRNWISFDDWLHEISPPQRTWVGLKEEDYVLVNQLCINPIQAAEFVDRLLKEKNT